MMVKASGFEEGAADTGTLRQSAVRETALIPAVAGSINDAKDGPALCAGMRLKQAVEV
jgi:hypothetical protein